MPGTFQVFYLSLIILFSGVALNMVLCLSHLLLFIYFFILFSFYFIVYIFFVCFSGESYGEVNGYGSGPMKRKNPISKLIGTGEASPKPRLRIGMPEEFRRVSAIIDVDIVPETHRRVKLMKNGSDKPLGFYIRDGTSFRVTNSGVEKVPGIFISRLVPGGLAESTGLLAVNDEVLEVNGIEVMGKTLDQVTDMMVANSANLIITVKPVNQRMTLAPQRGGYGRHSQLSNKSQQSQQSGKSYDSDDEDDVQELLSKEDKDKEGPVVVL